MGYEPVSDAALKKIAETGVCGIELLQSPDQFDLENKKSAANISRMCRDRGMTIKAFHSHSVTFDEVDTMRAFLSRLDTCYRQIDNLVEVGGIIWASHAHQIRTVEKRAFEALALYIENLPLRIGIENFTGPGMWVDDRLTFIGELNHPKIGLLLDIGHVRDVRGNNPMTIPGEASLLIHKVAGRLYHIHLHGFRNGVDHYPPMCNNDEIQWREIFSSLIDIEYDGLYNFEPKGMPTHDNTFEKVRNVYDNMRRLFLDGDHPSVALRHDSHVL